MTWLATAAPTIAPRVARPRLLVLGGLAAFVRAGVRRDRAGRRRADRSHVVARRGPLGAGDGVVALAFETGPDPARGVASRTVHGGQRLAVRRAAPVLRDRDRQLRRRGAAGADGPGAGRGHRRRVVAGVAGGRRPADDWPPPGHPTPPASRPPRETRATRSTDDGAGPAVPRGAARRRAARRPGRPGARARSRSRRSRNACSTGSPSQAGPGPARRAAAGRARAASSPSCRRAPTSCAASRAAAGRRAGRRAPAARARHPRRRPAAPGRAGGEPAPRPDPGRARAGARRRSCSPARSRPPPTAVDTLVAAVPRHLPARCSRTKGSPPRCGRRSAPARSRCEVIAAGVGRYSADVEAAAYFCCLEAVQNAAKHSGAADDPRRSAWTRPGTCSASSRTTAPGSTRGRPPPAPA